jgi:hypothetical protein
VIATHVRVACERFASAASPSQPTCSAVPIEFDHVPTDDELSLHLTGFGYVTDVDGKHLCLRHADGGERFTVTGGIRRSRRVRWCACRSRWGSRTSRSSR